MMHITELGSRRKDGPHETKLVKKQSAQKARKLTTQGQDGQGN